MKPDEDEFIEETKKSIIDHIKEKEITGSFDRVNHNDPTDVNDGDDEG